MLKEPKRIIAEEPTAQEYSDLLVSGGVQAPSDKLRSSYSV